MNEKLLNFINNRPELVAAYGYGSGLFKQKGYSKNDKPQLDLIFVVKDLKKWHLENIKLNKKDYSIIGTNFFKNAKINKIKGCTGITYLSNIIEDNNVFKYGTIEENDLLRFLDSWESFYLPGRFQKTIYTIKDNKKICDAINNNRNKAIFLAAFLLNKKETTKKELFIKLCSLSYIGDTRMKFAENPKKVQNIVEGSYSELEKIYEFDKKYFSIKKDIVNIDLEKIKKDLNKLPSSLYNYIKEYENQDNEVIIEKIVEYFTNLNKYESTKQTLKGISTNGIIRSIKYASKKIGKKFKK